MKKESNNKGCAIKGITVFLLCLLGFTGMMDGHSFDRFKFIGIVKRKV
jgi:hypothetical protein